MNKAQVSKSQIVVGVLGMLVSLYTFVEHLKLKITPGSSLSCDVNELVSCSKVFESSYGTFLSIPLGAYGMAFFGIVIAMGLLPKFAQVSERWITSWRLIAAFIGVATSVGLTYLSYVELKAICPACTTIHVVNLINFVWNMYRFVSLKGDDSVAAPGAFNKLISVSLALATPPIVAGMIMPLVLPTVLEIKGAKTQPTAAPAVVQQTAFPDELIKISKSNYVGKGEDYRRGNDNAKVVIQKWADFECPHCQLAAHAIEQVLDEVGADKVLFVYRNYPLSNKCNPGVRAEGHVFACSLALAARCAGAQGKFWPMHKWIFDTMPENTSAKEALYNLESLKKQAGSFGVDVAKFSECMNSQVENPKILDDIKVGDAVGLRGTPYLLVNGKPFSGNPANVDDLRAAIFAELR